VCRRWKDSSLSEKFEIFEILFNFSKTSEKYQRLFVYLSVLQKEKKKTDFPLNSMGKMPINSSNLFD